MNRPAGWGFAMLVAGTAAAATAPSRSLKAELERADAILARAEAVVSGLESAARGPAAGGGCPPNVRVKDLVADLRAHKLTKTLGDNLPEGGGAKRDWQVYHVCRALAASDPAVCADADAIVSSGGLYTGGLKAAATYRSNCEVAYQQSRAVAAYVRRDPRFIDICRGALPFLAAFKDGASAEAACRAWRDDRGGGHEPLLAALEAGLARPAGRDYLNGAVRELLADPPYCPKLASDYLGVACRELDGYRTALAAADAGKCPGGICRVLMGLGPESCDVYARSFMRVACEKSYAGGFAADSRDRFARLVDEAEAVLAQLDSDAAGPQELKQVGDRMDRLYALRERLDKAAPAASAPKGIH